ncbi:glycosyltransferase family 2 protein [Thiohalomonas denitrificans]|uniref:Glycosyltransferase involved in cell wall bisynthesis n=1 Tax=Thiohalomonas denitrificans TaxID=415747 RepID=A0A1G5Q2M2_9GAMM|nr:glycosyltransferase family 2 protein [Thiohalomonas denitrificans]SCZ55912.1 Glycosyltransferase involved in cell wall bisynthesis [Thiohalomonas denitrificans]
MDHSRPLVSVIIPTFNRARRLERAIKSALAQEQYPIEILVVDDHSTDDTEQIIRNLNQRFGKIHYLRNTRKKGPGGARNTGLLAAQGQYIAFLDSDDLWLPGHLQKAVAVLDEVPGIDLIFGNLLVFDQPHQRVLPDWSSGKQQLSGLRTSRLAWGAERIEQPLFRPLVEESFVLLSSVVMRSTGSGRPTALFNEDLRFSEDRDLIIRLEKINHYHFAYQHCATVLRNQSDTQLTTPGNETHRVVLQSHLSIYRQYLRQFELDRDERIHLIDLIYRRLLSLSYFHREMGDYSKAIKTAANAFAISPRIPSLIEIAKVTVAFATRLRSRRPASN